MRQVPLKNFDEVIRSATSGKPRRMVVAAAADEHSLEAVFRAAGEGMVSPVLVGGKQEILPILEKLGVSVPEDDILDFPDADAAAAKSVELIREGRADFLMKGRLETAQILRPVVNKETGIGLGGLMSHFTIFELPHYHKLLTVVDGGMVTYPTLEQKRQIIVNTVGVLAKLGYACPKVGVLAAVEKENPKMPETVEAAALAAMDIPGCIVNGPISLDVALDREAADIKRYPGEAGGDADVLIVPNIHVGNAIGKSITVIAKGRMAGFIVGAKVPIILTSRASSSQEKYLSIALAGVVAGKEQDHAES